jgi:hypothetical protein
MITIVYTAANDVRSERAVAVSRQTTDDANTYSPQRRWFRAPYRLLIINTALILIFMFTLERGWTDFGPFPFDCMYPPFLLISGPIVHVVAHGVQHRMDRYLSPGDLGTIRLVWNVVPGSVCLILGGIQWWLVELAYIRLFPPTPDGETSSNPKGSS